MELRILGTDGDFFHNAAKIVMVQNGLFFEHFVKERLLKNRQIRKIASKNAKSVKRNQIRP